MTIAELRALLAALRVPTPLSAHAVTRPDFEDEWLIWDANGFCMTRGLTKDEAQIIVAAVNALPDLLARLERAEALAPWVSHAIGCAHNPATAAMYATGCTCGLDAARSRP